MGMPSDCRPNLRPRKPNRDAAVRLEQRRLLEPPDRGQTEHPLHSKPNQSVWSAEDAQFVLDQGAQAVGVARVALPHPDWASLVTDLTYKPKAAPFTPQELLSAGLSPTFVDYMRRWRGFVTDGR